MGWVGVSALPRAQERCSRDLGSSDTWLTLEFYCVPARAWHSHASEYGRTEGRKGRKEGGVEEKESKAAKERSKCRREGVMQGREGLREQRSVLFFFGVFLIFFFSDISKPG